MLELHFSRKIAGWEIIDERPFGNYIMVWDRTGANDAHTNIRRLEQEKREVRRKVLGKIPEKKS